VGVRSGKTGGRKVCDFAAVVLGRSDHVVEFVGVLRGEIGVEDASIGTDEVLGGEGCAVGPARVGPEVKGPKQAVGIFPNPGPRRVGGRRRRGDR
jgi:hypothetical protein